MSRQTHKHTVRLHDQSYPTVHCTTINVSVHEQSLDEVDIAAGLLFYASEKSREKARSEAMLEAAMPSSD